MNAGLEIVETANYEKEDEGECRFDNRMITSVLNPTSAFTLLTAGKKGLIFVLPDDDEARAWTDRGGGGIRRKKGHPFAGSAGALIPVAEGEKIPPEYGLLLWTTSV